MEFAITGSLEASIHWQHLGAIMDSQIVCRISDWFIQLSKDASNICFGLFAIVSEYFALRTLSAIALSIFDQRIVDPCSQYPNMHPPYNTTDEATHIFIFKSLFRLILTKATYIYIVNNICGECSLSRCIAIVPLNLKYFFVVNNLFCNCSHHLKPHLVLPRVVCAL